jgi:hypothetical protein
MAADGTSAAFLPPLYSTEISPPLTKFGHVSRPRTFNQVIRLKVLLLQCKRNLAFSSTGKVEDMKIAQISPLMESVPPRLYGGTERIVSYLTDELVARALKYLDLKSWLPFACVCG